MALALALAAAQACRPAAGSPESLGLSLDTSLVAGAFAVDTIFDDALEARLARVFGWPAFNAIPAVGSPIEVRAWFESAALLPNGALRLVTTDSGVTGDRWVFWSFGGGPNLMCWPKHGGSVPCSPDSVAAHLAEQTRWDSAARAFVADGFQCTHWERTEGYQACHLPALNPDSAAVVLRSLDSAGVWNLQLGEKNVVSKDGKGLALQMRVGSWRRTTAFMNPNNRTSAGQRAEGQIRLVVSAIGSAARGGSWELWEKHFWK